MHGDAADEFVRIMLNGTEVAIRLTGSAAKNLAALLVAWSKNEKKVYGKTTMMKLLKSGEPLHVLPMTKEQYAKFKSMAKKKVMYAPFLNKKRSDGKLDVVISEKSLPLVNHILKRIGYGEPVKAQAETEEAKKKDTLSNRNSTAHEGKSEVRQDSSASKENPKTPQKDSVKTKLEKNRQQLKNQNKPTRSRQKQKKKSRSNSKGR